MHSWGLELTIDGFTEHTEKVSDPKRISLFVEQLVKDIDMVAYGPLLLEHFATHDPDKAGYSFVQLIETSSITGHLVDKTGEFYLNVFSCKDFEVRPVLRLVNEFFGGLEKNLVVRINQRQSPKR